MRWSARRSRSAAFVVALPALLAVAGCGDGDSGGAAPAGSGIAIEATLEPACPGPATTPPECAPEPYSGELEVADEATGDAVTIVTTDSAGHAEVALPPGDYLIQTPSPGLPSLAPVSVEVSADAVTQIDVAVDSGLR